MLQEVRSIVGNLPNNIYRNNFSPMFVEELLMLFDRLTHIVRRYKNIEKNNEIIIEIREVIHRAIRTLEIFGMETGFPKEHFHHFIRKLRDIEEYER